MVIFQYNLYIFGIHLWTVLYTKPCYNEPCYKEVMVYLYEIQAIVIYSHTILAYVTVPCREGYL